MYTKTVVSKILLLAAVIFTGAIFLAPTAMAGQKSRGKHMYRVTITNLTLGQPLAPSVIATHNEEFRLFELGGPTPEMGDPGYEVYFGLATAAETGYPFTLLDAVSASKGVDEAVVLATDASPPVLLPGESNSTTIKASRSANFLSIAAMLGKTNDGFYALRSVRLPLFIGQTKSYYANGYDAGSEENNETGIGGMDGDVGDTGVGINDGSGEGFIHVHVGIHGIGILDPETYDWRNPVVEVKIQRIR
jgi:hypothetical protein